MSFDLDKPANELTAQIIKLAMDEPEFRAALLADPRAALAEQGLEFPDEVTLTVLEETPTSFFLVLPPASAAPQGFILSDDELDNMAGGNGSRHTCSNGKPVEC